MSIEAMKQALEALKYHMEQTRPINMTQNAIHALRQAIEQAEKQEPRKEWVGLNWDDIPDVFVGDIAFLQGAKWALAKLKENNGG